MHISRSTILFWGSNRRALQDFKKSLCRLPSTPEWSLIETDYISSLLYKAQVPKCLLNTALLYSTSSSYRGEGLKTNFMTAHYRNITVNCNFSNLSAHFSLDLIQNLSVDRTNTHRHKDNSRTSLVGKYYSHHLLHHQKLNLLLSHHGLAADLVFGHNL